MAKKSEPAKKETTASATKAAPKKAAPKKAAPKKATAQTAAKTATPKKAATAAAAPKKAAPAAAPKKKAAPIKLSDKQTEIMNRIKTSGDTGYASAAKIEERTLEALKEKKLLKRGAKNKDTGKHHYMLTKTGEKHLGSSTPTGA